MKFSKFVFELEIFGKIEFEMNIFQNIENISKFQKVDSLKVWILVINFALKLLLKML